MARTLYEYRPATRQELEWLWEKDVAAHPGEEQWLQWRREYLENNRLGRCRTFAVLYRGEPVGQGTLLFSPRCSAVNGRQELANGAGVANVNALRIEQAHRGRGHMAQLMRVMEQYAKTAGCRTLTIGVEAAQTKNLAIYLHWGYNRLITHAQEEGALVLYYAKAL